MLVELNYPTPIPVELDPAQTLRLIVDMENESAHPKAPLYMEIARGTNHSAHRRAAEIRAGERRQSRAHAIRAQAGGIGVYAFQECHS